MSTTVAMSGLMVSSNALDIISNNIANSSTVGFKSSTPNFCDLVEHSPSEHPSQGSGVRISSITPNFNNGTLINTGRDLDISINQNGFFRVMDSTGLVYYTRNGQFSFDSNKNIVNMQGMYLVGESENVYRDPENNINYLEVINFKTIYELKSKPTTLITFHPILNQNTEETRKNYNVTLDIYGKNNRSQKIDITFKKKENTENTWIAHLHSQNFDKLPEEEQINHYFELKFNSHGQLIPPAEPYKIVKGSLNNEKITIDFTGTTQAVNNHSYFTQASQNGHPDGILKTFNILDNGAIIGTYSNQERLEIGQIILANFANPEKLKPEGANLWSETAESGKENIGTPGSLGFGILTNKTLEASNVDLNRELINMIIAQRNYQSNAQALKAEDKIISTLINLR